MDTWIDTSNQIHQPIFLEALFKRLQELDRNLINLTISDGDIEVTSNGVCYRDDLFSKLSIKFATPVHDEDLELLIVHIIWIAPMEGATATYTTNYKCCLFDGTKEDWDIFCRMYKSTLTMDRGFVGTIDDVVTLICANVDNMDEIYQKYFSRCISAIRG